MLRDKRDLRPEDMLKIQTDTYSYPHVFLAEQLVAAARVAPPKDARANKLIKQAKDWNGMADANSSVVSFLDATLFQALDLILKPHLGNDEEQYHWRRVAFLQRVLTERPGRWLPSDYKNYDELLSAAADQAVRQLEQRTRDKDPDDWAWKRFNYLDMLHPHRPRWHFEKVVEYHESAAIGNGMESPSREPPSRAFRAVCGEPGGLGWFHPADYRWRIGPDRQRTLSRPVSLLVSGQSDLWTVFGCGGSENEAAHADVETRLVKRRADREIASGPAKR